MHRRSALTFAITTALTLPVLAASPATAQGRVVLSVTGRQRDGAPARHDFDLPMLEALGLETLSTRTTWTGTAEQTFAGVRLARVIGALGLDGTAIRATALNDYAVDVPMEDVTRHGAFLATRQDGVPLRVRDRGPIWLIYPWSDRPELDIATFRERAIWQLRRLDLR